MVFLDLHLAPGKRGDTGVYERWAHYSTVNNPVCESAQQSKHCKLVFLCKVCYCPFCLIHCSLFGAKIHTGEPYSEFCSYKGNLHCFKVAQLHYLTYDVCFRSGSPKNKHKDKNKQKKRWDSQNPSNTIYMLMRSWQTPTTEYVCFSPVKWSVTFIIWRSVQI